MNDSLKKEYDTYFSKFYKDFYKYQTGSKKQLNCPQCSTKKRFIFNKDQLIFSCGPKHSKDKKCGPQYTIDLPKYINFRDLLQIYDKEINGSFNYQQNNLLEYDLKNLTEKININDNSLIINFISILILCIGIIILYYRLIENKTKDLEKQNTIISFHQYVKENIK